jgi:hypothetical protein
MARCGEPAKDRATTLRRHPPLRLGKIGSGLLVEDPLLEGVVPWRDTGLNTS